MKWLWRCTQEEHSLWKDAIKVKYEKEGRWMTKDQFMEIHQGSVATALEQLLHKVADGSRTDFWKDIWLGTESLQ